MQHFIKEHKYFFAIIVVYFLLRIINLTLIPIFNDESIYLDWGSRAFQYGVPYYSLSDGKQPFLMWIFGLSEGMFTDPLFAGRIVSVIAGIFTVWGLYRIGREIFNEKIALLAASFYVITPLFLFYDRQALMESSVAATEVWTVFLLLRLFKKHSIINAILLGGVIGVGFFIKSTILLLILAICVVYIFFTKFRQKNKLFWLDISIALAISQLILWPLYSQPLFWQNLSMNDRYTMSVGELAGFPIGTWFINIWSLLQVSFWHLTPFVFIAAIVGIVLYIKDSEKEQKIFLWIFLFQIVFFILVAKGVHVRYSMPMLPLSLLFVAAAIYYYSTWRLYIIMALTVIPLYFLSLQIFLPMEYFNQMQALTQFSQKDGYVTNQTAGYATMQAVDYIQSAPVNGAIVAVRLNAGNPENAMFVYFHNSKTRKPTYLESRIINHLADYQCLTYPFPIYFISREQEQAGLDNYLEEEKRFYNPEQKSSVGVYHLRSSCQGKTLNLASPGAILPPDPAQ